MDSKQFFDRVRMMRHFQKIYFKNRSRMALHRAMALEQEIDREIERTCRLTGDNPQQLPPTLFE